MRKKVLSVFLVLCMVLGMLPMTALAAGEPTQLKDSEVEVTVDSETTAELWKDVVTVDKSTAGTIAIDINLDKLNEAEKTAAFAKFLTPSSKYFTYGSDTKNGFTKEEDGAQLCLPIQIKLNKSDVTGTLSKVRSVRWSGDKNMDEGETEKPENGGEAGTSVSASYSADSTTVTEWPVIAWTAITCNTTDNTATYKSSTNPFEFNKYGATGTLNTWKYALTWTANNEGTETTYTTDVVIKLTKTSTTEVSGPITTLARPNAEKFPSFTGDGNGSFTNGPWSSLTFKAEQKDEKNVGISVKVNDLGSHEAKNSDTSAGTTPDKDDYYVGIAVPKASGDNNGIDGTDEVKSYYAGWGTLESAQAVRPDGYQAVEADGKTQVYATWYFTLTKAHLEAGDKGLFRVGDAANGITYTVDFTGSTLAVPVAFTLADGITVGDTTNLTEVAANESYTVNKAADDITFKLTIDSSTVDTTANDVVVKAKVGADDTNGTILDADNQEVYTLESSKLTDDITIEVSVVPKTTKHTITFSISGAETGDDGATIKAGGTAITGNTAQAADKEDFSFTVEAQEGYTLKTVNDGTNNLTAGGDGSYKLASVADDMTITVTVQKNAIPPVTETAKITAFGYKHTKSEADERVNANDCEGMNMYAIAGKDNMAADTTYGIKFFNESNDLVYDGTAETKNYLTSAGSNCTYFSFIKQDGDTNSSHSVKPLAAGEYTAKLFKQVTAADSTTSFEEIPNSAVTCFVAEVGTDTFVQAQKVTFTVTDKDGASVAADDAAITVNVKDGAEVTANDDGSYYLPFGAAYTYSITASSQSKTGEIVVEVEDHPATQPAALTVTVQLEEAAQKTEGGTAKVDVSTGAAEVEDMSAVLASAIAAAKQEDATITPDKVTVNQMTIEAKTTQQDQAKTTVTLSNAVVNAITTPKDAATDPSGNTPTVNIQKTTIVTDAATVELPTEAVSKAVAGDSTASLSLVVEDTTTAAEAADETVKGAFVVKLEKNNIEQNVDSLTTPIVLTFKIDTNGEPLTKSDLAVTYTDRTHTDEAVPTGDFDYAGDGTLTIRTRHLTLFTIKRAEVSTEISTLDIAVDGTGVISGDTATKGGTLSYYIVGSDKLGEIDKWTTLTDSTAVEKALDVSGSNKPTLTGNTTNHGKYLVVVEYDTTDSTVLAAGKALIAYASEGALNLKADTSIGGNKMSIEIQNANQNKWYYVSFTKTGSAPCFMWQKASQNGSLYFGGSAGSYVFAAEYDSAPSFTNGSPTGTVKAVGQYQG